MAVGMSGFRSGVSKFADEAFGGSAQGVEDVPPLLLSRGDDGAQYGEVVCVAPGAEAAGDFLAQFHHAQVALGLLVGERRVRPRKLRVRRSSSPIRSPGRAFCSRSHAVSSRSNPFSNSRRAIFCPEASDPAARNGSNGSGRRIHRLPHFSIPPSTPSWAVTKCHVFVVTALPRPEVPAPLALVPFRHARTCSGHPFPPPQWPRWRCPEQVRA